MITLYDRPFPGDKGPTGYYDLVMHYAVSYPTLTWASTRPGLLKYVLVLVLSTLNENGDQRLHVQTQALSDLLAP